MKTATIAFALVGLAGCASHRGIPPGRKIESRTLAPPGSGAKKNDGATAHIVATVANKTIGPFLARGDKGALAAWIANDAAGARKLFVEALESDGDSPGDGRPLADVPPDATTLVLRAATGSSSYFAVWSGLLDRGETLALAAIGADGAARGAVNELARTNDHVVWAQVVPTARGALVIWAEETRTGEANVLAVAVDGNGKSRGLPSRIAQGVVGWQAVAAGEGAGLALLAQAPGPRAKGGQLSWLRLDAEGRAFGSPVAITNKPTAGSDFDVARANGAYVFAWTDRSGDDPDVVFAAVDDAGKVQAPKRAVDSVGGGVLEAIASGESGVVVAWSEAGRKQRGARRVRLTRLLGGDGGHDESGPVDVRSGYAVELTGAGDGFAMLAETALCTSAPGGDCPRAIMPAFVRFDARLAPAQTEAIVLGPTHAPAALAWNLACAKTRCLALAASSEAPTPVSAIDLAPRASTIPAPVAKARSGDAPRLEALKTLVAAEPIADLAVTAIGDGSMVATISQGPADPRRGDDGAGDRAERGAVITLRAYDAAGEPKSPPFTITKRAQSTGGVSIAASEKAEEGAAIAWVGRDGGDLQVHVSRVNAAARRTNEVQLTSAKGDAADVAIAAAPGGGWILAWVDSRDGNGEVYVTRIDRDLNRTTREERLTRAPGDAGDVALLVRGDTALLAWSDPRESATDGMSDIYTATVQTKDCRRASDDVRVLATAAHSRSPSLAMSGDSPMLAWIEQAPLGLEASSRSVYGAMLAKLDPTGKPLREPWRAPVADDGLATEITLDGSRGALRAYEARSAREEMVLDAFEVGGENGAAYSLLAIEGPPSLEVGLAAMNGMLFYADQAGAPGERRLRRATLGWKR